MFMPQIMPERIRRKTMRKRFSTRYPHSFSRMIGRRALVATATFPESVVAFDFLFVRSLHWKIAALPPPRYARRDHHAPVVRHDLPMKRIHMPHRLQCLIHGRADQALACDVSEANRIP